MDINEFLYLTELTSGPWCTIKVLFGIQVWRIVCQNCKSYSTSKFENWSTLPIFDFITSGKVFSRFWYIVVYCVYYKVWFRMEVEKLELKQIEKVQKSEQKSENGLRAKNTPKPVRPNLSWVDINEWSTFSWNNYQTFWSYISSRIY